MLEGSESEGASVRESEGMLALPVARISVVPFVRHTEDATHKVKLVVLAY